MDREMSDFDVVEAPAHLGVSLSLGLGDLADVAGRVRASKQDCAGGHHAEPGHGALLRNSMEARTLASVITWPVFGRIASSPRWSARKATTPSSTVQN